MRTKVSRVWFKRVSGVSRDLMVGAVCVGRAYWYSRGKAWHGYDLRENPVAASRSLDGLMSKVLATEQARKVLANTIPPRLLERALAQAR